MLLYLRNPYSYMRRLFDVYGDPVTMPSMNGLLVITGTPEGAKEILDIPNGVWGGGFASEALEPILGGDSLLLSSGQKHRNSRKVLSPTFHGAGMRRHAAAIARATLDECETWRPGAEIRLHDRILAISLDVIIRAVLGIHDPERIEEFRLVIRAGVNDVSPMLFFFKGIQRPLGGIGPWARFVRARDRLKAMLEEEICRARRTEPGERADILAKFAHLEDAEGRPLPSEAIQGHLLTLLVAGHETTSSALAWTFSELSREKEVTKWLLDDLRPLGDDPDPEILAQRPSLLAVAREGLRLHPIIPEFFRTVKEPTTFRGYSVPPGAVLTASILQIHQNPELYPEPDKFRPGRFIGRAYAPHEFAAFGGGHRYCLGSAFALSQMAIIMGLMLRRFDFELCDSRPIGIQRRNVTLAPKGGVLVTVTPV